MRGLRPHFGVQYLVPSILYTDRVMKQQVVEVT